MKNNNDENRIRINKFLASCGLGSRRKVEELINNKEIRLNGKIVTDLATTVDPENDSIKYKNKLINSVSKKIYLMLNKSKGFITTVSDPFDRPTVMNLIPEKYKRAGVFPVGRLDKDTEGLLLFTNDGDLAQKIMNPKFYSEKEYIVHLESPLSEETKKKIEKGISIFGRKMRACKIEYIDDLKKAVKITISEGKKRQIRMTFSKYYNKVKKLKRISIGPLELGRLKTNDHRLLRKQEVENLKKYLDKGKIE